MKPPAFDLVIAESLRDALDHLGRSGSSAKILAGGQSLMPMLNMRLVTPLVVIDISRIAELSYIRRSDRHVEIGAATTQRELHAWPDLRTALPLLALAIPHIGHFQTRNRGTVCGSICHADPSSELPLSLATLNGEVVLRRGRRERVLSADAFQSGMLSNAAGPDEMVVAVRFPVAHPGQGFAFREVARRHGDFAVVALAAMASNGKARLGVGGLSDKPTIREFNDFTDSELDRDLNDFAWDLGGADDIHATARYRREMVRRLGKTVIREALHAADR
jgi:2-furoyl-CoA dehydrogenase FAD binding subunit